MYEAMTDNPPPNATPIINNSILLLPIKYLTLKHITITIIKSIAEIT